jgi:hypothetical protein
MKPDLSLPSASLHFESITQFTAQSNFRAGDFLSAHGGDFLALAEREISAYLGNLFETVPLPPGLAPVEFVGESSGLSSISPEFAQTLTKRSKQAGS